MSKVVHLIALIITVSEIASFPLMVSEKQIQWRQAVAEKEDSEQQRDLLTEDCQMKRWHGCRPLNEKHPKATKRPFDILVKGVFDKIVKKLNEGKLGKRDESSSRDNNFSQSENPHSATISVNNEVTNAIGTYELYFAILLKIKDKNY